MEVIRLTHHLLACQNWIVPNLGILERYIAMVTVPYSIVLLLMYCIHRNLVHSSV